MSSLCTRNEVLFSRTLNMSLEGKCNGFMLIVSINFHFWIVCSKKDHVDFNKNKDRCDGKGGRGRDKEMTSKGKRMYHVNHGSSYKEPLSMQELKELIDSLRAAPEGTTLITFRRRA